MTPDADPSQAPSSGRPGFRPPFDIAADLETPVSAYRKLRAHADTFRPCFLLESVEGGARLARFSFIGLDPAFTAVVRAESAGSSTFPTPVAELTLADGSRETLRADPPADARTAARREAFLDLFRALRRRAPSLKPADPAIPLAGGLVGATGYDAVRFVERLGLGRASPADAVAVYAAPRSVLVFDHLTRRAALLHAGESWERESLRREVLHALRSEHPAERVRRGHAPPSESMSREAFLAGVGRAKNAITEGEVFQLVLSVRSEGDCRTDPFRVYRALRLLNPSSYMYYLDIEGRRIVGSSPEALFRSQGGTASLRPIAGTRPRGGTPSEDAALERELLADPKEAAEHVMLVDLARNDIGRVARPGSVLVEPYRVIERYSHVMHLVSGVTAKLREGADALDVLAASFPAGTLVGTPKVRAMELIDELEPVSRGFYGGTVGYLAAPGPGEDGASAPADQAICIRTLTLQDDRYAYQAGAGVVADSVPEREHEEVYNKSRAMSSALRLADEDW